MLPPDSDSENTRSEKRIKSRFVQPQRMIRTLKYSTVKPPALRMLPTNRQCFGMAHPGAARTRSITVSDSFRVQPELFRLLMTRTANDHVEKYQAILLTENPVLAACGYFVAMLANEFHSASTMSKPHTQKNLSVKLSQMTQTDSKSQSMSHT